MVLEQDRMDKFLKLALRKGSILILLWCALKSEITGVPQHGIWTQSSSVIEKNSAETLASCAF